MAKPANSPKTDLTVQGAVNLSFDKDFEVLAIELLGYDSLNNTLVRLKTDSNGVVQTNGASSFGPINSPYVVTSADAVLTADRVLTGTASNVSITDNGANSTVVVDLINTAVTPGSYGNATTVATFTVDQKGRLTLAGDQPISFPAPSPYFDTVNGTSGSAVASFGIGGSTILSLSSGNGMTMVAATGNPNTLVVSTPQDIRTSASPTFNGLTLTNPLTLANGGTGLASYTQGDLVYFGSGTAFTKLAKDTNATRYLSNKGLSNNPSWSQITLTNGVTGKLPIANGGTNQTAFTTNGVVYFDGTSQNSSSNLTYNGSVFNVNNAEFRTVVNTSTIPASNAGLSVIWNYSGGSAEVDLFNIFEGAGTAFSFYQKITSTTAERLVMMTRYFTKFTNTSTDVNAGVQPVNVEAVHDVSSNTSQRTWGLNFNAKAKGSGNFTDSTAGLTGFEGLSDYNGTGTMTRQIGGLVYFANTNTGTITEGIGLYAYPLLNNGGGTVTTAVNLQVGDNLAVTANNQVRVGLKFQAGIPGTGGFTGTKRSQQWFAYDSTDAANGIAWGASLDTIIYRGASAQLNLTGSLVVSRAFNSGVVTVTDGAGAVIDASLGNTFDWTAGADRTAGTTTNFTNGQKITIRFTASGGARTLTLPTAATGDFAFGSDITGLTATASGMTDCIGCIYSTALNRWLVVAVSKGY